MKDNIEEELERIMLQIKTEQNKIRKKRERNNLSSKIYREKKKKLYQQKIISLHSKINTLQAENTLLKHSIEKIEQSNITLLKKIEARDNNYYIHNPFY